MIDEDGSQAGIITIQEALALAEERQLDLVEIAPKSTPPVCKVMDYGKYLYEKNKTRKQQKKKVHTTELKEIRFRPKTDVHDYEFKMKHIRNFIESGYKVKASVDFRGREIIYQDRGRKIVDRLIQDLEDIAKVDRDVRMEGKSMSLIFIKK